MIRHTTPVALAFALATTPISAQTVPEAGDDFTAYVAAEHGAIAASEAREKTIADLRSILAEVGSPDSEAPASSALGRMIRYFRADTDTQAMDAAGLAPLAPLFERIDAAQSRADLAALMASPDFRSPFSLYVFVDMADPSVNRASIEMQA